MNSANVSSETNVSDSEKIEPPLSFPNISIIVEILSFGKVFTKRLYSYLLGLAYCCGWIFGLLNANIRLSKRFFVRLLMYRGGYFYQTHRLGAVAITSTTVFSMVLAPVFNPIQELNALALILSDPVSIEGLNQAAVSGVAFDNTNRINTGSVDRDMRNEVLDYVVQEGDTVSSIAENFLVSVESLKYVNELGSDDLIHSGDELTIPPVGGIIHPVDEDETISSIAELYSVSPQVLVDFNHLQEPYVIHKGDEVVVPDAKIPSRTPQVDTALAYAGAGQVAGLTLESISVTQTGTGGFVMPSGGLFTQYFWWGHTAVDIAGGCGAPIVAADSGTITFAGWWPGGGGNSIFVDHGNGYSTKYAHMSGFAKTSGTVQRGELIGYEGATGRAFGCHIHFIVEQGGRPIDPLSVL